MRALDTNVVVRYLSGDDPGQAARAKAAIDAGDVFVSRTVLLQSAWVLRSVYGLAGEEAAALRAFSGLPMRELTLDLFFSSLFLQLWIPAHDGGCTRRGGAGVFHQNLTGHRPPFLPWARALGEWNGVSTAPSEASRRRSPRLSRCFR